MSSELPSMPAGGGVKDWNAVLAYLKPKEPLFAAEKPSVRQTVFLRTNAIEALYGGAAGGGKAERLLSLLPTPHGFVPMVDIHPGSVVFGRDGQPQLVLAESEVMRKRVWRLTFDDGATVEVAEDHLWLSFNAVELAQLTRRDPEWKARRREARPSRSKVGAGQRWNHTPEHRAFLSQQTTLRNQAHPRPSAPPPEGTVRATAEIVATLTTAGGRRNHAVPLAAPLQLPNRTLPVDPYVLGAWLGDGYSHAGQLCGADPAIFDECDRHFPRAYTVERDPGFWVVRYDGLLEALRVAGVLNNKRIPAEYLWASEDQRLALLQGLMDTDGTVAKGSGSAEFCNTNRSLAEGVAHLARSLGMKATVREGRATLYGKDCGPKWTVKFVANRVVFRLDRKASIQKIATRRTAQFRYIISAEDLGPQDVKCIQVEAADHLYLTSEHLIPTHNSSALLMAALQYCDVPGYSALLFRRTLADLVLPGALMDRFKTWIDLHDDIKWNANSFQATFPSGARVSFGYLNNKEDYLRYKGTENQFIGMDEVTEIRESDYRYMFSRLRRPASGPLSRVPLRMRAASNPAPNWVRQRFIIEGREKGRIFVPAKMTDNPGVDVASYRQALAELDPIERRRLEEGDWFVTSLGSLFDRNDFVFIDDDNPAPSIVSREARVVRFWDLAATEPSATNPDPDWSVGTLMMMDQGRYYILDVVRARRNADGVERLISDTAAKDGRGVAIRMEREPGSAGKIVADQFARFVVPGYDFDAVPSTGDKVSRSRPYASAVANGNVYVAASHWTTDWLDEHASFPEAVWHDDQVDSATGAFLFLSGLGLPQRKRATIIV